jgi:hypothetical protein
MEKDGCWRDYHHGRTGRYKIIQNTAVFAITQMAQPGFNSVDFVDEQIKAIVFQIAKYYSLPQSAGTRARPWLQQPSNVKSKKVDEERECSQIMAWPKSTRGHSRDM